MGTETVAEGIQASSVGAKPIGATPPEPRGAITLSRSPFQLQTDDANGASIRRVSPRPVELKPRTLPLAQGPRGLEQLVGRQRAVGASRTALEYRRTVEIVGHAGIGKTALVRAVCTGWLPSGAEDGIILLPKGRPLADQLLYLLDSVYVRPLRHVPDPELVRSALRRLRLLVVLDDPQPTSQQIADLAGHLPESLLLVAGSHQRLEGSTVVPLDGLSSHHSLELLEAAVGHRFSVDESHATRDVVASLGGDPLSLIRLAALARQAKVPLADLVEHHRLAEPEANLLEAVLSLTTPQERSVLQTLAGFGSSGVDGRLVAGVVKGSDPRKALQRLRAFGLADGDDVAGWRASADVVSTTEERAHAQRRLARWVTEHAGEPQAVADISAAVLTSEFAGLAEERPADVIEIARASESALARAGNWAAWQEVLQAGLQAAREDADAAQVAYFEHQLGAKAAVEQRFDEAITHLTAALGAREFLKLESASALTRDVLALVPGGEVHSGPPASSAKQDTTNDDGTSKVHTGAAADQTEAPPEPAESPARPTEPAVVAAPVATEPGNAPPTDPGEGEGPAEALATVDQPDAAPDVSPSPVSPDAGGGPSTSGEHANGGAAALWTRRPVQIVGAAAVGVVILVLGLLLLPSDDGSSSESDAGEGAATADEGVQAGSADFEARLVLQPPTGPLTAGETTTIPVWVWNSGPDSVPSAELQVSLEGVATEGAIEGCETTGILTTCDLGELPANAGSPGAVVSVQVTPDAAGTLSVSTELRSGGEVVADDAFAYPVGASQ